MGHVNIWVHTIWTTKRKKSFLTDDILMQVIKHIKINAAEKGIYLDCINGSLVQMHCLIALRPGQSIAKVMMYIKGESSRWINKNRLTKKPFEWQDKYLALSLSPSSLDRIRRFISNRKNMLPETQRKNAIGKS